MTRRRYGDARPRAGITAGLALGVWLATAVTAPSPLAATARAGRPVMGTILQVAVTADDGAAARRMAEMCIEIGARWDDVLTTWREDGELQRLNASAGSGPFEASNDLLSALEHMRAAAHTTGGAFEPGVGPVVMRLRRGQPVDDALRHSLADRGIEKTLELTSETATLATGAALDAGGIGKGIALDAMAEYLLGSGVQAAFLDFGGSSQLAVGKQPTGSEQWTLVLAGFEEGTILGTFTLEAGSLSTSRASPAANPAGAIVDPRSGRAVEPPVLVTVHADDATTAEYWSTALIVLGRNGLERARAAGVEAVLEDANGIATTPGFAIEDARPAPTR
ncbi:MAG: hypothetical protein E4H03_08745 [Myxococcales bacterium]|nr:MAG: hypothetical protein E4H03_08745 [Myxococcales bacterium]